jgi:hypothetical protein
MTDCASGGTGTEQDLTHIQSQSLLSFPYGEGKSLSTPPVAAASASENVCPCDM